MVEIVFTRLHAGGKFDKGSGGAYSFSGGLHGVGVSVTNALARRLEVTVCRGGQVATLAFAGGDVVEPLAVRTRRRRRPPRSGTTVRVWPDPKYFESAELPQARAGAPAAQQGGADARRDGDAHASSAPAAPRPRRRPGSTRAACATTCCRRCPPTR